MSDQGDYAESPLQASTIYRGAQTPGLTGYVPLPVFIAELMLVLAGIPLLKLWLIAFLPLHLIPVSLTNSNPFWVRDFVEDMSKRWFVSNKGEYGKGVVSFNVIPRK